MEPLQASLRSEYNLEAPELRGSEANPDWIQVRLRLSGGQYDTQTRNQVAFNPLNSLNESQTPWVLSTSSSKISEFQGNLLSQGF